MKSIVEGVTLFLKNPKYLRKGGNDPFWIFKRFLVEIEFERKKNSGREFVSLLLEKQVDDVYWEEAQGTPIPLLAVITRIIKPKVIVETGVQEGSSSLSFLYALEKNNYGKLYSIEIGKPITTIDGAKYSLPREKIGYLVPQELRHRWKLILGDSKVELPKLLKQLGEIDIFFHDSLHTEEHMMFEYNAAWPFLRNGGRLLSDNIGVAFKKFAQKVKRPYVCTGDRPKMGGIRK